MAKVTVDKEEINEFLNSRYIEAVLPSKEKAAEMLGSGKRLTFYLGIDPTGPDIHLGHTTNFFVLKKLFQLGHRIILLIGDFTATVGDPTDKESERQPLTEKKVKENMKTYIEQVTKILKKGTFDVKYNSKWLAKMSFRDFLQVSAYFSVQNLIARDMFQERLKKEKRIGANEFLYPLMQGYDSVAMEIDGEIGGKDQMFNMMVGRELVNKILGKEKLVITTRLLEDPETGKKIMNKSEGQYISLNDSASEMFGKTMAMPDSAIEPLFTLATEVPDSKIDKVKKRLEKSENPKNLKEELAYKLTRMYHGEKEAGRARDEFRKVFSEGQLPEEIKEYKLSGDSIMIIDLLEGSGMASSRSEAKRLIGESAVRVNNETVSTWDYRVKKGDIVKVGPRRFVKAR